MAVFSGSCLCGSMQYSVSGEPTGFYHCHCSRCRKFSGTGHATNIRVDTQHITWNQGQSLIKSYKVPEAERFRNDFCGECGSPVPRYFREAGFVVIPAGTLDHDIEIKPEARIFYGSRTDWSCCDDELPVFEEYPK